MITFYFHGNLADLLPRNFRTQKCIRTTFKRRASVKDFVESYGVPHPEIDKITISCREVDFHYLVKENDILHIHPISPETNFFTPSLLRRDPLKSLRFVVDVNVAKITGKLRMLGFDTYCDSSLDDARLAAISSCRRRILLTRDRNLLKRNVVEFGHLIRSRHPKKQLAEVFHLFNLQKKLQPFSRCLHCNGLLSPVAKKKIEHLLEPLTLKYYDDFQNCLSCGKIYWQGSHRQKMAEELDYYLNFRSEGEENG